MGLTTKESGGERVLPKAGTHHCVITGITDLGRQEFVDKKTGEKSMPHQVELTVTLPHLKHTWDEKEGPQPFTLYRRVRLSSHVQSTLYGIVTGLTGAAMPAEYDISNLAGMNGLVNVSHTPDGAYANMSNFGQLMDNMEKVDFVCSIFDISNPDQELFETFPDWRKAQLKESPDWPTADIPF